MRDDGRLGTEKIQKGFLNGVLMAALLAVVAGLWSSPLGAQQGWSPTVATSPGGTLNAPAPLAQPMIDPRFFPSSRAPVANSRNPLPQGAWSPIVTGAIPNPPGAAQRTPPTSPALTGQPTFTPGQAAFGGQPVPPVAGAAGVTPTSNQTVAASEGTAAQRGGSDKASGATAAGGPAPAATGNSGAESAAAGSVLGKPPGPLEALPPNATPAQQYCFNTADQAADARIAWQAKKIKEMESELDKRAQQLEAKTEEYKRWLERRDEFSRKAHEKLVGFYSRMRPDAAALQLATLDEEMAAAVVTKLETKVASAIMGEMDPERAAKIATIISGAARIPPEKRRPVQTTDGKPPDAASGAAPERPRS